MENRIGKGKPGPGRPKGSVNKATKAIKEMVIEALDKAGGVDYLLAQSRDNPTAFLTLVGKTLPLQVAGDPDNPLQTITQVQLVGVRAN
jgi:hypothetical protein